MVLKKCYGKNGYGNDLLAASCRQGAPRPRLLAKLTAVLLGRRWLANFPGNVSCEFSKSSLAIGPWHIALSMHLFLHLRRMILLTTLKGHARHCGRKVPRQHPHYDIMVGVEQQDHYENMKF